MSTWNHIHHMFTCIDQLFQGTKTSIMEEKGSPHRRSPPVSPVPFQVELGKWRRLSPRLDRRLGERNPYPPVPPVL